MLHLTDKLGKKVMETTTQVQYGHNRIKVAMGNEYPAGFYVLNILADELTQPVKIIKK